MQSNAPSVWLVSREYAGLAEAGGVKNVVCSLAESLARAGYSVTVFLPAYGFIDLPGDSILQTNIRAGAQYHDIRYFETKIYGVRIVLVESSVFLNKHACYTYTSEDEADNPEHRRGTGHADALIMNLVHQKAVISWACAFNTAPQVLHCQDAHTALLPALIANDASTRDLFRNTGLLVTIHNAGPGYRQSVSPNEYYLLEGEIDSALLTASIVYGHFEPFLCASSHAALSTVSPWYAKELTDGRYDAFSGGLSSVFQIRGIPVYGITNGIDSNRYDCRDTSRSLLPFAFDPESGELSGKYRCRHHFISIDTPAFLGKGLVKHGFLDGAKDSVYFCYQGRIAAQKGIEELSNAARLLLERLPQARIIVLGQGEKRLEDVLIALAGSYPGRCVFICGYEKAYARMAVASADFLVLPSLFEPCGLEDLIGQLFGTIPVARAVGGLQKIKSGETGFLFTSSGAESFRNLANLLYDLALPIIASGGEGAISVDTYRRMIMTSFNRVMTDFDWDRIVKKDYFSLYSRLTP